MERPLIALAEDVRRQFPRRAVIGGQERVFRPLPIDRIDMRHGLHIGARQVPREPLAPCADAELAFRQVDEVQPRLKRKAERAEAAVRENAVAVKLPRTAGGKHDHRRAEKRQAPGVRLGPVLRAHGQDAVGAVRAVDDPHARGLVEDRDAQPDRLLRQNLHHQARGARPAACGAAGFVMVGLVAQRPAIGILRQRQAEILQGRHGAARPDRLDIGGILIHRAAGTDGAGHSAVIVAPVGGVGGVQRLLVRAGAGRGSAPGALRQDRDVDPAPRHLNRRTQARGAAAKDDGARGVDGDAVARDLDRPAKRRFGRQARHVDIGQRVKDGLVDGGGHGSIFPRTAGRRLKRG